MLVDLKTVLKYAEEHNCAIGSFNATTMTSALAIIGAAEELNCPVIIMHAQVHEELGFCNMETIAPVLLLLAQRAKVPICVHLDHGTDMDYVKRGIELGFTSVMYDGSELDEETNLKNTDIIRELTFKKGVSLEAEIGSMGTRESGQSGGDDIYTSPEQAKKFAERTGVDALACAFGTAHGLYLKKPKLDLERLEKIHELVKVPLVMHGGSGVSHEDYVNVINRGIRKINYYTYMAKAGGSAVKEAVKEMIFYHDIEIAAEKAMRKDVLEAMNVFIKKEI